MSSTFMTAEEEKLLRIAIREAFEQSDWAGDLGFLVADKTFLEAQKEAPPLREFQVMVLNEGAAAVVVPAHWEEQPYLKELLQGLAAQELSRRHGIQPD